MYTDKPIPGAVRVSTGTQRPPEVAARAYAQQQSAQNSQLAASNQRIATAQNDARIAANVAKDLEATRADRCKKARADYTQTINSRRLYRDEPGGKRTYLIGRRTRAPSASKRRSRSKPFADRKVRPLHDPTERRPLDGVFLCARLAT